MQLPVPLPMVTPLLTGPRLVGIILNWYLHGLLTVQYILYLMYSRRDRVALKFIVHFLFLLDSAQTILTMTDAFFWFVYGFGNPAKLFQFHLASIDVPTFDAIIAFIVQSVYCWRIWTLSRWRVVPALTMLIALLAAVCGFITGVRDFADQDRVVVQDASHRIPIMIWLLASAVADVSIASSMAYILLRAKRNAIDTRNSTGRKVVRILTLTVETNAVTAAVAIEIVIIFFIKSLSPPRTFVYEPGGYVLGKLYSNCFMVLLNQRHGYRTMGQTDSTVELGTMPNFAAVSDSTSGDRTSGISSTVGDGGHRILGRFAMSKPGNLFSAGEESRSDSSLPSMQFAKVDESGWDPDCISETRR